MTALVPFTTAQKLVLKDKALKDIAAEVLPEIPQDEPATDFPEIPEALKASEEIRNALAVLSKTFNTISIASRRELTTEELGSLGVEYEAIKAVGKLLGEREEIIKEYVRTHQDVEAEAKGLAVPKDVVRGGRLVTPATPRDPKGHYLLAAKGEPTDTAIPGTTLRFSNQFASGKTTENLGEITEMYERGELSKEDYYAMTEVRRVPSAEKIRAFVLKTGRTELLAKIVKKGRDSQSLFLRALKKR